MQPYQEEYIANLKDIAVLTARKRPEGRSFETYLDEFLYDRKQAEEKARRNMTLLKEELFPVLDRLFEAKEEDIRELREFAGKLTSVGGIGCRSVLPDTSGAVKPCQTWKEPERYHTGTVLAGYRAKQPV